MLLQFLCCMNRDIASVTWTLALGRRYRDADRRTTQDFGSAKILQGTHVLKPAACQLAGWMSGEHRAGDVSPRSSAPRRNDTDTKRYREPESRTHVAMLYK